MANDIRYTARRSPLAAVVLVALLCTGAAKLEDRGSPADQEACTPDVFRLCSDLIPDEPQILACLKRRHTELSPACGQVITPPEKARRKRTRA